MTVARKGSQGWQKWLRANGYDLAPCTGQDFRALAAIAACWDLVACSDAQGERSALAAVRALLPAMQEKCRPLARALIARSLDWDSPNRLWTQVSREGEPQP